MERQGKTSIKVCWLARVYDRMSDVMMLTEVESDMLTGSSPKPLPVSREDVLEGDTEKAVAPHDSNMVLDRKVRPNPSPIQ